MIQERKKSERVEETERNDEPGATPMIPLAALPGFSSTTPNRTSLIENDLSLILSAPLYAQVPACMFSSNSACILFLHFLTDLVRAGSLKKEVQGEH